MYKIAGMSQCRQPRAAGIEARGMTAQNYGIWYRATFSKRRSERAAKYWLENKERLTAERKLLPKRTKEKAREYSVRAAAKDSFKAKQRLWKSKNPEKVKGYNRKHQAKLRSTPRGRIDHRMSSHIYEALHGKKAGRKWESLAGYTLGNLMVHIESLFKPGMNWDKVMAGRIHIDHRIPKSKFHYESAEDIEFKRCWALENLQPMWAHKNQVKCAKIIGPVQIPLGV